MAKKKFIVLKASERDGVTLNVNGKPMPFGTNTKGFTVSDPGVAKEIEAMYGKKGSVLPGEAVVAPLNSGPEPGHPRSFLVPELPWKKDKKA